MRAAQIVEWGERLVVQDAERPEPKGREVLLRVTACGICHSDIHIWDGYFDLGGDAKISMAERGLKLPFTMGHEPLGEVVAMGPDAEGVEIGDRRILYPWVGCGECDMCERDEEINCPTPRTVGTRIAGGYAEYVLAPDSKYLVAFDGIGEDLACTYACSSLTAYSALKKLDHLRDDDATLIIGAGGVGMSGVGMAKAVIKGKVIVADADAEKRAAARQAGADEVLDNTEEGALEKLMAMTGGKGIMGAVDFVGAPATAQFAFQALRKGAKMVMVGLYGGAMPVPTALVPIKAVTLQGSYVGTIDELREILDLARQGKVTPIPVTTRPLDDAPQAIQDLREGKVLGRVVLKP